MCGCFFIFPSVCRMNRSVVLLLCLDCGILRCDAITLLPFYSDYLLGVFTLVLVLPLFLFCWKWQCIYSSTRRKIIQNLSTSKNNTNAQNKPKIQGTHFQLDCYCFCCYCSNSAKQIPPCGNKLFDVIF